MLEYDVLKSLIFFGAHLLKKFSETAFAGVVVGRAAEGKVFILAAVKVVEYGMVGGHEASKHIFLLVA